jgi:hypothetical protein
MKELGICVPFQQPLLSSSLPAIFFLCPKDVHHLIFKVIEERPPILIQSYTIGSDIQLLDSGEEIGLSHSSMLT